MKTRHQVVRHARTLAAVLLALAFVAACGGSAGPSTPQASTDLAPWMADVQRTHDKLGRAIRARNPRLARYYGGELDQRLSEVRDAFPKHETWPVGALIDKLALPALPPLDEAIQLRDWDRVDRLYSEVTETCNSCHAATERDYLVILPPSDVSPYAQEFEAP